MVDFTKIVSISLLIFAYTGCSSNSTDDGPLISRNSLPFATDDIGALVDQIPPGETLTIVLRSISINQPGSSEPLYDELEFSFTPTPNTAPESRTGTLVIEGRDEPIVLVNGEATFDETNSATLTQVVLGSASILLSLEENDLLLVKADDNNLGTTSKSYAVLGFETSSADTVAFLGGIPEVGFTEYSGDFVGLGELVRAGGNFETMSIHGGIEFDVFGDGLVEGFVSIHTLTPAGSEPMEGNNNISELGGSELNGEVLVLGMEEGTLLDGNGFEADLIVVGGPSGTSSSKIGGVLYGASAEEISGTATIDFSAQNGATLLAVGGYVATVDTPDS